MNTRRRFLAGAGAGLASAAVGPIVRRPGASVSAGVTATQEIVVSGFVAAAGIYLELPFTVPLGVNRIDLRRRSQPENSALGLGLFDQRGPGYQSAGFRGVFGEEAKDDPSRDGGGCFVSAHAASEAFMPGTIEPGVWTVLVPVFRAPIPGMVEVTVTLSFGHQAAPFVPGPMPGVVRPEAGWYRGDLHCHTPHSSDAWNSGSALSPSGWAAACRDAGMDYAAMTDHNVVSQNFDLAADSGTDVLLMAGEEMTNWFHGHATVSGIEPGEWLDWRQSPGGALPTGKDGARIRDFLSVTREMGAFVSAAHPMGFHLSWQFFPEAEADEASRTDGIEVWTGPFQPDDEAALAQFDRLLTLGHQVVANGGSDLHGVENTGGFAVGTPTTVVWATELSQDAIVAGLKAGRSFITRLADGVEIYLEATGPDGQRDMMGGTILGGPTDTVTVEALVRNAGGMRFHWVVGGVRQAPIDVPADEHTFMLDVPIGAGTFVRAEVRDQPEVDPTNPLAGRLDMEAFTNPIFLRNGTPPVAPPPVVPEFPSAAGALALAGAAGVATAVSSRRRRRSSGQAPVSPDPDASMTISEVQLRASAGLGLERPVTVVGVVAADDDGTVRLVRTVPGCCPGEDTEVTLVLHDPAGVLPDTGSWSEVRARWRTGTTFERGGVELDVVDAGPVPVPPPLREDVAVPDRS